MRASCVLAAALTAAALCIGRAAHAQAARHHPPQRQDRPSMTRAPAQALAVRDGKIAAIGSSADIRALAGPATRVIDLGGRTVIPGLIDSHIHAIRAGPDLHHRGALDRRPHAGRSARPHPRRGQDARRRAPGWSSPAAGPSGSSRRTAARRRPRSPPPRPIITSMSSSSTAACCSTPAATTRSASRATRTSPRALTIERDRDGTADRLAHRRQPRHQRPVRPAAAADLRAEGRRHARVLPRAQRRGHHRRDRSRRLQPRRSPTTSRCSRSGASAG